MSSSSLSGTAYDLTVLATLRRGRFFDPEPVARDVDGPADADADADADEADADADADPEADADAELLEAVDAAEANNATDEEWLKKEDA